MAEEGGLFSGLKFTDIFFPAAASVASMYNPHIGRGLQTGLNMFNSFQDFQNSARYYKQLKEQNERQQAGVDEARAGLDVLVGTYQDRYDAAGGQMGAGDPRREGPILDESETSKHTLFGEEGPELADPGNFSLHMKEMEGIKEEAALAGGPMGQALDLGMEEIANPKFSDINTESIAENSVLALEQANLQNLMDNQAYNRTLFTAAPGVAAQASTQGSFQDLSAGYRDAARKKDLLAAMQQQESSAELAELERQAQVRQVEVLQKVYDESDKEKYERSVSYAERFSLPKDPTAPLTYSQQRQLGSAIYSAYQDSQNPGILEDAREAGAVRALQLALEAKDRGLPVPEYMQEAVAQYELATTGQVYPGMPSHEPTGAVPAGDEKKTTKGYSTDVVTFSDNLFGPPQG